jgi:hypothetical protein
LVEERSDVVLHKSNAFPPLSAFTQLAPSFCAAFTPSPLLPPGSAHSPLTLTLTSEIVQVKNCLALFVDIFILYYLKVLSHRIIMDHDEGFEQDWDSEDLENEEEETSEEEEETSEDNRTFDERLMDAQDNFESQLECVILPIQHQQI